MLTIILDILLTAVIYMIYPFVKFHKKKHNYEKKEIKKILILNSVIIGGLFIFFSIIFIPEYKMNFAPAFLYYCINSIIWETNWKKQTEDKKKEIEKKTDNNNTNTEDKKTNIVIQKHFSALFKIILISSVVMNIILVYLFVTTKIQNTKYTKTINYLIDDNFVKAEKYINKNNLYKNINYSKLVNKNNNPPTRYLCNNGPCVKFSDKNYCKRFNVKAEVCNSYKINDEKNNLRIKPIIDLSKYKKAKLN